MRLVNLSHRTLNLRDTLALQVPFGVGHDEKDDKVIPYRYWVIFS